MTPIRLFLAFAVLAISPAVSDASLGENLIVQRSFDEGIEGWENLTGKIWEQTDDRLPMPEQPNPGSLEMLATDNVWTCVPVVGDQPYEISTYVKIFAVGEANGLAGISLQWHSDELCDAYIEGPILHPFSYRTGLTDWVQVKSAGKAPLTANSAKVYLGAQKTAGGEGTELRARFDDVVVAPIYGDTTTTSTTTTSTSTSITFEETTTTTDEPNAPGCADPLPPYDTTTASDALYVLRSSVGVVVCGNCHCDTDGSGQATASDALRTLRLAVGNTVPTSCGACDA
jgi:hypothetical protein